MGDLKNPIEESIDGQKHDDGRGGGRPTIKALAFIVDIDSFKEDAVTLVYNWLTFLPERVYMLF